MSRDVSDANYFGSTYEDIEAALAGAGVVGGRGCIEYNYTLVSNNPHNKKSVCAANLLSTLVGNKAPLLYVDLVELQILTKIIHEQHSGITKNYTPTELMVNSGYISEVRRSNFTKKVSGKSGIQTHRITSVTEFNIEGQKHIIRSVKSRLQQLAQDDEDQARKVAEAIKWANS